MLIIVRRILFLLFMSSGLSAGPGKKSKRDSKAVIQVSKQNEWEQVKTMLHDPAGFSASRATQHLPSCEMIPSIPTVEDFKTILSLSSQLIGNSETCLSKIALLLLDERLSPQIFRSFVKSRCERLSPSDWGSILEQIVLTLDQKRFSTCFFTVLECNPYLEALAPHFRPAFDDIDDEEMIYHVKLAPLYYILQPGAESAHKLINDFTDLMKPDLTTNLAKYLKILDRYIQVSNYLRRSLSNETYSFDVNHWLNQTFLDGPQVVKIILDEDLYHLYYILTLPGVTKDIIEEALNSCAVRSMALYLGRTMPSTFDVKSKSLCNDLKQLIALYRSYSRRRQLVPCSETVQPLEKVALKYHKISTMKTAFRGIALEMVLMRILGLPFGFSQHEELVKDPQALQTNLNKSISSYCDGFGLQPAAFLEISGE